MKKLLKFYQSIFSQEHIDKTISGGISGQIRLLIISILTILAIASLLVTIFHINLSANTSWSEQMWEVYNAFIDQGNMLKQTDAVSRVAVSIIGLLGSILLGGILISTISNIMERRVDVIRLGKAYYKNLSNQYVIIGYNSLTPNLIKELYQDMMNDHVLRPIIVMSNKKSEWVRHQIQMHLTAAEEKQIYIYFGNIESKEELKRLNIDKAKEVYILSEEEDHGRDAKNIQCVRYISELRGKNANNQILPVYTQFDSPASYSVIQKLELPKEYYCVKELEGQKHKNIPNIYFRPFNFHENWARQLWSIFTLDGERYDALDYYPIEIANKDAHKDWKQVHLVIAGFGRMGQALLLEALRICHYAYYDDNQPNDERTKTRITIIDKNMSTLRQKFESLYPNLDTQIQDITIDFRDADICDEEVRKDLRAWCQCPQQQATLAICISDPDISIQLGLNLPSEVYHSETRVLIRQEIRTDLGKIIHNNTGRYRNVKVFGMLDHGVSKHILKDELSCYVHMAYEVNEENYLKDMYHDFLTDKQQYNLKRKASLEAWFNLDENMRWANRYQLDAYIVYIRTMGMDIQLGAEENHKSISIDSFNEFLSTDDHLLTLMRMEKYRWNAERTIEGWEYGATRDNEHRIHPLLVPFYDIPKDEQYKDRNVINNLPYLLPLGGYSICSTEEDINEKQESK